ncbi:MAG: CpXC domain-containing protein [Kofleriaceae bacterium]|nr:CpXC domain-containing protein [Kofleriaceae bacterium]
MSVTTRQSLLCPCGAHVTVQSADTINVTRAPEARVAVLEGRFHTATCGTCGQSLQLDRRFLYTDLERAQLVHVLPSVELRQWKDWHLRTLEIFQKGSTGVPEGLSDVHALLQRFVVRTVFGPMALREKIHIWEEGLDDRLIEVLKIQACLGSPDASVRLGELVFVGKQADELDATPQLVFGTRERRFTLPAARYDILAADRPALETKYPVLFSTTWVSARAELG